jgi:hypothetical protein
MRIGYAVQGSTDRAFLRGLKDRWCPAAEMVEGAFRGSTGLSLRRELHKICDALLRQKRCERMVVLTDADESDWQDVRKRELGKLPGEFLPFVVYGIADRNIECWLCADPLYIAQKTGRSADEFRTPDPKSAFQCAMAVSRDDKKETEIAALVSQASNTVLKHWLRASRSFEDFYDQLWALRGERDCPIENLRERASEPGRGSCVG